LGQVVYNTDGRLSTESVLCSVFLRTIFQSAEFAVSNFKIVHAQFVNLDLRSDPGSNPNHNPNRTLTLTMTLAKSGI